jgi:hypothetical protein
MAPAHINPTMLRWAMERVGATNADLAAAFKKPTEAIAAWLVGDTAPTFKQAQQLAKRLRVPFGFLFLAEPPADELPLADSRRVHGSRRPTTSVDLRDVISDVLRKQDWYRDFRVDGDEEPFSVRWRVLAGRPSTRCGR